MQINTFCDAYLKPSLFHRPCLLAENTIDPVARFKEKGYNIVLSVDGMSESAYSLRVNQTSANVDASNERAEEGST
jgi:hypothetical protein